MSEPVPDSGRPDMMTHHEHENAVPLTHHTDKQIFTDTIHDMTEKYIQLPEHRQLLADVLWILGEHDLDKSRFLLYEIIVDYSHHHSVSLLIDHICQKHLLWSHPNLRAVRDMFHEQDEFVEKPPEIDEGVIQCKRCRSKRTFSFSKQTRRGDESTTVFVRCSQCYHQFRI